MPVKKDSIIYLLGALQRLILDTELSPKQAHLIYESLNNLYKFMYESLDTLHRFIEGLKK